MKTEATSPEDTKDKTQKTADGKVKKQAKRGRKPSKIDMKAKLERSRQSARECRARKKLRYQYLEEMVANREKTIITRRQELDKLKKWCEEIDGGNVPPQAAQMARQVQNEPDDDDDLLSADE
ncbi:cAMP-responsive element-binding protein-like 2 [Branchiostoma floridae x Branchiostoma belcheri]